MDAGCARCGGEGWTCESHPSRPWGDLCCDGPRWADTWLRRLHLLLPFRGPFKLAWRVRALCEHGACHCGGAGAVCGDCNPDAGVNWLSVIAEAGS